MAHFYIKECKYNLFCYCKCNLSRQETFLSSKNLQSISGPTQTPVQFVPGNFPEEKATRAWGWPLFSISSRGYEWVGLHLYYFLSWREQRNFEIFKFFVQLFSITHCVVISWNISYVKIQVLWDVRPSGLRL
jgi:hypothetical protein